MVLLFIRYHIKLLSYKPGAGTSLTVDYFEHPDCIGSNAAIISARSCTITFESLRNTAPGLYPTVGNNILISIQAEDN